MIEQLKEKFKNTELESEKVKILTVLPKSWSEREVADTFETTRHKARVAKKLADESGCLADPNPKKASNKLGKRF